MNGRAGTDHDHFATSANTLRERSLNASNKPPNLGYFDNPNSIEHMKQDRDLDIFRDSPEYKELLERLPRGQDRL